MGTLQLITVDPSSLLGYERKHEALRAAGHHVDGVDALEIMLSKMSESSSPEIRGKGNHIILISFY